MYLLYFELTVFLALVFPVLVLSNFQLSIKKRLNNRRFSYQLLINQLISQLMRLQS